MSSFPLSDTDLLTVQPDLPDFEWMNGPAEWIINKGSMVIASTPKTDFFRSPRGAEPKDNAPFLFYPLFGDFSVRTHLTVDLKAFGDAGGLTIRLSPERWAKLCIERSPAGEINIVSVVTDGYSDDANNELLSSGEAFLRITRRGSLIGFHYSLDGKTWRFARNFHFEVPEEKPLLAGIHVQSPYGDGCSAVFNELIFSRDTVKDFKSGE
jgi:hypothetical protein